jgi:microcystin-dependent protein
MSNILKLKNSGTASAVPSSLEHGELGINYADGKIFYKNASNNIVEFSGGGGGGAEMPAGSVTQFAGSTAPTGWLSCDGTTVSRTTYAALFSVIGTTYGSGDGSTTFALPNMKGRIPVGFDSTQAEFDGLGETGGAKTHTLTSAEMPSHTHTQNSHNHTQDGHGHTTVDGGAHAHGLTIGTTNTSSTSHTHAGTTRLSGGTTGATLSSQSHPTDSAGTHGHGINSTTATNQATTATNQNTGGGGAHNNLQPYIVLNYIIKA